MQLETSLQNTTFKALSGCETKSSREDVQGVSKGFSENLSKILSDFERTKFTIVISMFDYLFEHVFVAFFLLVFRRNK